MKSLYISKFIFVLFFLVSGVIKINSQEQKTNLPTFYIDTEDGRGITSKTDWKPAFLTVVSSDPSEELENVGTDIRGRGNSTWGMAKKPYRIKLNKKTNLLNLPAREKNWVLLANYADKTLIRNAVAFEVSRIVGLEFSPSARFIDLVLNGQFVGNYMVTDQMEVRDFRVPVETQEETDVTEPKIQGGYLVEIDGFANNEPKWFTTGRGIQVTVKYPKHDEINTQQFNYIRNYVLAFENRLFASNFADPDAGYRTLVDTVSLVNWYIGSELTGNSDAFWSTYFYKYRTDERFYFGPMWDYDIAFNNDNRLGDATRKLMQEHGHGYRAWVQRFWQDEWFQKAVERRWNELVEDNLYEKLALYIDDTAKLLEQSQTLNYNSAWPNTINRRVYLEQYLFSTYQAGIDYLKTYLGNRIDFLSLAFTMKEPLPPSEPFVPEDFYYMIMNGQNYKVISVENESVEIRSKLVLWEPKQDDDSQLWEVRTFKEGIYQIVNKKSGLSMTAAGRGNSLTLTSTGSNPNIQQQWKITPVSSGSLYGIEAVSLPNYSVNNSGGSINNGNPIIQWDNAIMEDEPNQHWYFQKREAIEKPTDFIAPVLYSDMDLYPNPAYGSVSINYELQEPADVVISIFDTSGKLVYRDINTSTSSGNQRLSISFAKSGISPGIYLVNLKTSTGISCTKRLIIH